MLEFWSAQNEIVREAVRHPLKSKKPMLERELPLVRIPGVTEGHSAEITESRVSQQEMEKECRRERQKERGEITY
jgi:hypothetical protein